MNEESRGSGHEAFLAGTLPGYAQGGVVADGIAYFVSGSRPLRHADGYPHVGAFDVRSLKFVRSYDFGHLGDSTPLVIPKRNGDRLVVGHENRKARTAAFYRDSGEPAWVR